MFHLLLEQDKKQLRREYSLRRILICLVGLLLLSLVSVLLLLPSAILTRSKEKFVIQKSDQLKASRNSEEDQKIAAQFDMYKQKIALLVPTSSGPELSVLITALRRAGGANVSLISYFYNHDPVAPFTLIINGTAKDRQSLVSFSRALENEALFSKIELPVSDLAKDKNISFTIQLTGKQ